VDVGEVLVRLQGDVTGLTAAVNTAIKNLEQISQSTKRVEQQTSSSFQNIAAQATKMAGILGVALGAGAFVNFVRQSFDAVARINDLAEQTDIAASTLLSLKSIAEEAGSSIELFARAGFQAQRQLSEIKDTTDPVYQAIQRLIAANKGLGLSFDDLRRMNTGDFLETLAKMLQNVTGYQDKLSIATAFFGSRLAKEMIPVLDQMAKGFDKLLSDEDIAKIDQFTDRWTRLQNQMASFAAGDALKVLEFFDHLGTQIPDLTKSFDDFKDSIGPIGSVIDGIVSMLQGDPWGSTATDIEFITQKITLLNRALVETIISVGEWRKKLTLFGDTSDLDAFIDRWKGKLDDLNETISNFGQPSSHTPAVETPNAPARRTGSGGASPGMMQAALEQKKAIDGYIDSLKNQNIALIATEMAFDHTEAQVKAFTLQEEKATFIDKLLRDSLVKTVPPELLRKIDEWNAKIVATTRSIEEYKGKLDDAAQSSEILGRAIDAMGKVQATTFSDVQDQLDAVETELGQIISAVNTAAAAGVLPPWMDVVQLRNAANAIADIKRGLIVSKAQGPTALDILDTENQQDRQNAVNATQGVNKALAELVAKETSIKDLSKALGVNYDSISDKVSLYTDRIKELVTALASVPDGSEQATRFLSQLAKAQGDLAAAISDQRMQASWNSLADSINGAINTSIDGVIQGTQTLAEAMRNMAKSIMLAFINELTQQFILNPILDLLFGGRGAGGQRQFGGGLIGSLIGLVGGVAGGAAGGGLGNESFVPTRALGGPLFSTGMFKGHQGEVVLSNKAVQRMGGMGRANALNTEGGIGGSGLQVSLDFQGAQIIPRAPWATPEDVVKVGVKHLNNDEMWLATIKKRLRG